MTLGHRVDKLLQPSSGDDLEAVLGSAFTRRLHRFPMLRGISAPGQQLAAFLASLAGFRKRYLRIDTQRETLFLSLESVFPSPPLAIRRIDLKVQTSTVPLSVRLLLLRDLVLDGAGRTTTV